MKKAEESLDGILALAEIELEPAARSALGLYLEELERWSKTHALISRKSPREAQRQTVDSLLLCRAGYPERAANMLDIGSGAGFPSIPVKILTTGLPVTALEPNLKKAAFLKHIKRLLGLEGLEIRTERAEETIRRGESYSLVTAKALAKIREACSLGLPLTEDGGRLVIFGKVPASQKEEDAFVNEVEEAGGDIEEYTDYYNPLAKAAIRLAAVTAKKPGRRDG